MNPFETPVVGQIVVFLGKNERQLIDAGLILEARRRQWGTLQPSHADQAAMRTLFAALVRALGKVEPPHYTHARRSMASTLLRRFEGLLILGLQRPEQETSAFLRWLATHEQRPVVLGTTPEGWAAVQQADIEGRLNGIVAQVEPIELFQRSE
jgi:hypothetical protein